MFDKHKELNHLILLKRFFVYPMLLVHAKNNQHEITSLAKLQHSHSFK